jgi:hypothetical protein
MNIKYVYFYSVDKLLEKSKANGYISTNAALSVIE